MADDLDDLLGDELDEPNDATGPEDAPGTVGGPASSRRVWVLLAAAVVLIVAAGAGIGLAVGRHNDDKPAQGSVADPPPSPIVTVTITETASPVASPSPSVSPTPSPTQTPSAHGGTAARISTLFAYYDAINAKDWQQVWELGGKNLDRSYDAMVAGYADTAKDLPYLTGYNGNELDLDLLAFRGNGRAQLFTGSVTIEHGALVGAHETLAYADRDEGFSALAGDWAGHDRDLEITPGGLGILSHRSFRNCPTLAEGCDRTVGNLNLDGATTVFRLDGGQADTATGHVISSTVPASSPVTLTYDAAADTVTLSLIPNVRFCGSDAAPGACGA